MKHHMFAVKTMPLVKAALLATAMLVPALPAGAQEVDLSILEPQAVRPMAIRRLSATTDQLRLEGEMAERTMAIYAPRDEVLKYRKLQVDYLTAVSAAPESSNLAVFVNGQVIGAIELKAGEQNTLRSFDLPPGLLVEGFNEIRFLAQHRHRVDCTIPATYELWTALNPANTGLVFDPGPGSQPQVLSDLDILRSIPTNENGATNIQLVQIGSTAIGNIDRALAVAQSIAVFGKYLNPDVRIQGRPGTGAGLDIILGTRSELSQAGYVIGSSRSDIPGLALVRTPVTGRIALIISADNRLALDQTIETLASRLAALPVTGSRAGVAAFANKFGRKVDTGRAITLSQLGVTSKRFDGRLLHQDFSLNLPNDFFVGDYGKATLGLNVDALGDLSKANKLQVFANGAALASADLTRTGISSRNPLNIPLGGFSPGYNEVRIEVSALTDGDAVCNVAEQVSGDRLYLSAENSAIEFDTFARMRVTPNVAVKNLLASAPSDTRPTLVQVPADDPASLETAVQLVVASAALNQEVRPVSLVLSSAPVGTRPGLIVAPVDRLSGAAKEAYLETINQGRRARSGGITGLLGLDAISEGDDSLWADVRRYAGSLWRGMGFRLSPGANPGQEFHLEQQDVLFAQRTTGLSPDERWVAFMGAPVKQDAWTVVTGLGSEDIKTGVSALLEKNRLSWLNGDTSLYKASTGQVVSERFSEPNYFATVANPSDWRNTRLVVAGVISHNMLSFVLFMAAFCVSLGFVYFIALKKSGR
ncbi:cellulose biosynthesis cyclic di-GMP-binding regulatory protein BcsB [uncultured Roseibium sp.]|uniref:cellulose biosynthesis cyclic di-GMP-binding regulatory protein BcsB n=1 Tax=uncultured Roseibium sp. TaxID=1936171 RepID=UPI00261FACB2|nr:cellulose biosynthesis cyclic di-GMP-binding regulatory protein BcsB [uncultured Roseibium sp.]